MRKPLLALAAAALMAFSASAQTPKEVSGVYRGDLYISLGVPISGETTPLPGNDVEINANGENTIDLALRNFSFMEMNLGDIVLNKIPLVKGENGIITFGENPKVNLSLGGGAIQATAKINETTSYIHGDTIVADIDVAWIMDPGSETPIYVRLKGNMRHLQLANGNFEGGYSEYKGGSDELGWNNNRIPTAWNWFNTATGSLGNVAASSSVVEVLPDESGNNFVKVSAGWFLFTVNGNLTTGCINADGFSATDASTNYNYSDPANNVGQKFTGRPDSISFRYAAYTKDEGEKVKYNAIIHGNGRYQDPAADGVDYSSLLWASATLEAERTVADSAAAPVFKQVTLPLVLGDKAAEVTPAAVLSSLSTNVTPGGGQKGDYIALDDVRFVYNSRLASFEIPGMNIPFKSDIYEYYIAEEQPAAEPKFTVDGRGATATMAYDDENSRMTVTVKGDDWSSSNKNEHTYTFHFGKTSGIGNVETEAKAAATGVYTIGGVKVSNGSIDNLPKGVYIVNGKKVVK